MGNKLGVLTLSVILACCSSTIDNRNISIVFFRDGQKNIAMLSPDEQLIEEEQVNSTTVYKDKLGRWETSAEIVLLQSNDGSQLVQDVVTKSTYWKYRNESGEYVTKDLLPELEKYNPK